MLVFLPLRVSALELQLENYRTATSQFEFKKFAESTDAPISIGRDAFPGSSLSYDLWMEPEDVSEVPKYDYFRYIIYVRPKANPSQVTRVTFRGKSGGGFDDQIVDVHFTVIDGARQEDGTIQLPIFGRLPSDALSSKQPEDPLSVYIDVDNETEVRLTNEKQMPVTIAGASASSNDRSLWQPLSVIRGESNAFTPFVLAKGANVKDSLKVFLRPRKLQAFLTALTPSKSKEDDVITVRVRYSTLAREEMSYLIPVRVRFEPRPLYLPIGAVVGAVVGWLILLAVRARKEESRDQLRILVAAVVAAFLIEILGMLLAAGGSQLKFLGFPIDPFQLLPATLIGLIAGLAGYQSRVFLLKISRLDFFKFGNTGVGNATA